MSKCYNELFCLKKLPNSFKSSDFATGLNDKLSFLILLFPLKALNIFITEVESILLQLMSSSLRLGAFKLRIEMIFSTFLLSRLTRDKQRLESLKLNLRSFKSVYRTP